MTREEARTVSYEQGNGDDLVVDEIYDDFESRICGNCKHWNKQVRMCDNKDSFAYDAKATVVQGDSCNKFEEKD